MFWMWLILSRSGPLGDISEILFGEMLSCRSRVLYFWSVRHGIY
jgi:hypothetical protein